MLGVGQVVSVVHVQLAELDRTVSANDAGWIHHQRSAPGS